jgi:hypothetical protein
VTLRRRFPVDRYLVFARTRYEDPLSQEGSLEVAAGDDASLRARECFGDHWLELILIPEDAVSWLPMAEADTGPAEATA